MSVYTESDHPRNRDGTFRDKPSVSAGIALDFNPANDRDRLAHMLDVVGVDDRFMSRMTDREVADMMAEVRALLGGRETAPPTVKPLTPTEKDLRAGDAVLIGGTLFQRPRPGVFPDYPTEVALRVEGDNPRMADFAAYTLRASGVHVGGVRREGDGLYTFDVDVNGGANDRLFDFEDRLAGMASEGTPVRKTDRQGPGTRGTRAIDGLGRVPTFAIYCDQVLDVREGAPS